MDDAMGALRALLRAAVENGASEVHALLPTEEGVQGGSAMRVTGILVDIDPLVEEALGRYGQEVVRILYGAAMSGSTELTREHVLCGRVTDAAILPEGMEALDVTLVPGAYGRTHVLLRPRPMPIVEGRTHESWEAAARGMALVTSRPAPGLSVFLSPEADVATLMMQKAANLVASLGEKRIMVFDSMPWSGMTNLGVADLPSRSFGAAALAAAASGVDVIVLDELQNIPDGHEAVARLLMSGTHVWTRLRASTALGMDEVGDAMMLASPPRVLVKAARIAALGEQCEPLTDPGARAWMAFNNMPLTGGSMQRTRNADYPVCLLLAELEHAKGVEAIGAAEGEGAYTPIARLGAFLVDAGVACGVDASKRLA